MMIELVTPTYNNTILNNVTDVSIYLSIVHHTLCWRHLILCCAVTAVTRSRLLLLR